jgi:hypothetical protein
MVRRGTAGHGERPQGKRAIYGTFPQLGAPIGFILANLLFIWFNAALTPGGIHRPGAGAFRSCSAPCW